MIKRNYKALYLPLVAVIISILGICGLAEPKEHRQKPSITLRSSYKDMSLSQVQEMIVMKVRTKKEWGFYGHSIIKHDYEKKTIKSDMVVIDHATGLMWDRSGSEKYYSWYGAQKWVVKLNEKGHAGYKDWRLPTLEEAACLLEPGKRGGLYIDELFDRNQPFIWTGDRKGAAAWLVSYRSGSVYWFGVIHYRFIRPVRTIK